MSALQATSTSSERQRTALVVDDEASIRLLCRINLEADGWRVEEAADGVSGVEQAKRVRPDVVLLDVMMPGLDGWGTAERLISSEETKETPIVFLTARAEIKDRVRGIEAGGIDYLTKPFDPVALAERLDALLGRVAQGERFALRQEKLAELRDLLR